MQINLYKTKRWRRLRKRILRRDKYKCQESKRYGQFVEATTVHHVFPVDKYPELAFEEWNLISLSAAEHNAMHDRTTNAITAKGIALQDRIRNKLPPPYSL